MTKEKFETLQEKIFDSLLDSKTVLEAYKKSNLQISYNTFRKYANELGFKSVRPKRKPINQRSLEEIFSTHQAYNSTILKTRLIESGLKKKCCEHCGLFLWQGEEISLELHHVDGDRLNNSLENLRILCPNCHSKTENFKGRKNLNF